MPHPLKGVLPAVYPWVAEALPTRPHPSSFPPLVRQRLNTCLFYGFYLNQFLRIFFVSIFICLYHLLLLAFIPEKSDCLYHNTTSCYSVAFSYLFDYLEVFAVHTYCHLHSL